MRLLTATLTGLSLLASLASIGPALAQDVSQTSFDNPPTSYFYFKDSEVCPCSLQCLLHAICQANLPRHSSLQVMLLLDADFQSVWRSGNQGKTWSLVEGVPKEARAIFEHPFDKNKVMIRRY